MLQRQAAPPAVKQHMAAIRMMFSWFRGKRRARLKTERFSRTEGKTPGNLSKARFRKLLDAIEVSRHTGLRDRGPIYDRFPWLETTLLHVLSVFTRAQGRDDKFS
jgi:hypothetical protein